MPDQREGRADRPDSPPTGVTLVLLGVVLGVALVILLGWVNAPQQQKRDQIAPMAPTPISLTVS